MTSRSCGLQRKAAKFDLLVEGACNLPLGISTFWWDHPELQTRWREPQPGRLESAELVVVDEAAWRYAQAWDFLRRLMLALPEDAPRAVEIANGLRDIHASIDARDPVPGMEDTAAALDELVQGGAHTPATACVAVGHAHIDTAWLWPLRETRRKCVRSFSNVLRLQERFRDFHFLCSQAQQYEYVKQDAPEVYAQIARRVKEGRWEAGGAMWIEPDCTCPSGESFVRQIVHGTGFWENEFGAAGKQRFLYLPDTFGFPPCLPQIARLGGLDTFITNKMSWCETNRFPHVTFMWRGLDGSEILTHLTPGHNYNSSIEPKDMLYGEKNLVVQDGQSFSRARFRCGCSPSALATAAAVQPTGRSRARSSQRIVQVCRGLNSIAWTCSAADCTRAVKRSKQQDGQSRRGTVSFTSNFTAARTRAKRG